MWLLCHRMVIWMAWKFQNFADLVLSRSVLTHEVGEEGIARFIGEKIRELWKK